MRLILVLYEKSGEILLPPGEPDRPAATAAKPGVPAEAAASTGLGGPSASSGCPSAY
ncbi:hypothetical protein MKY96_27300 [Paenibacillus sp. FSL R7-0302]|uniref:hypothetical protein n=1 Tax=Paenibacillus sp. FSL R7-0302 TaxID=2921681 RepID=UPI0030FB0489